MKNKLTLFWSKLKQRLWFRPALFCAAAIVLALIASEADGTFLDDLVPEIKMESVKWLLDTIASSMLVISIFAVTSMLSAFSAAQNAATPRSFKLVIADDVSQNALSVFISAFIFGIVASVAINNGYFGKSGRFILFLFALVFFALIILVFLRWVDRISRLGRLEHTIHKIEEATSIAIIERLKYPYLKAKPYDNNQPPSTAVFSNVTGYIQSINFQKLQAFAEKRELTIRINSMPGRFVNPGTPIAFINIDGPLERKEVNQAINKGFSIGKTRDFDSDPRFGLIALSEIASRALSTGINDPGTAIQIIGTNERLFYLWDQYSPESDERVKYDRIEVPKLNLEDLFEDSFRAVARDGAGNIEVMLKMQKAFHSLHLMKNRIIREASLKHSKGAFSRAEQSMASPEDIELLRKSALFSENSGS
ncbi:DUF2254 domain-containing protein [Cryomorphaceae bacterium 1068]|nr:DUF2254 domain-containing protein [Cryomorphaceae bacterium 1068]